jgi:small subunit ribosomal protein S18
VSEEPNSKPGGDSSPGDSSSSGGSGPSFGGGRPGGGGPGRGGRPGGGGGGRGGKRYFFRRRKVCKPCADKIDHIDYKDVKLLSQFVPERGKLLPRRMFGTCAEHQRKLTLAIKRARHIALLPFQGD